jgi:hypothetical protein
MAVEEITVDTNVFKHANNKIEPRQAIAAAFISSLLASNSKLCVDEGFDMAPAKNRSLIGGEYLEKLVIGELGYIAVATLASKGRISFVSKSVPAAIGKKTNQMIPDKRDRTFVRVAYNSSSQYLVSHDYADLPQAVRDALEGEIAVHIVEADAVPQLA